MNKKAKAKRGRSGAGIGTLGRAGLGLALAIALVLSLAAAALLYLEQQRILQAETERAQTAAQGIASDVASQVKVRGAILDRFVREEGLARLLLAEQWDALKQQERRFKRLIPGVIRLRILPKEWDERDSEAMPPFSFASLDMLRGVEADGKPSPVELHYAGKAAQHLVMAVPVADDGGELVGVAHLAFAFDSVEQVLQALPGGDIPLQLRQQVPSRDALNLAGSQAAVTVQGRAAGQ